MNPSPDICAACGAVSEGNYSVHRDGFAAGPEVPLCDACGSEETPTLPEIWECIRARLVDYHCRDCQKTFQAEHQPQVHALPPPCPKCEGKNTYEAYTESE